jgi:hypothetical protein
MRLTLLGHVTLNLLIASGRQARPRPRVSIRTVSFDWAVMLLLLLLLWPKADEKDKLAVTERDFSWQSLTFSADCRATTYSMASMRIISVLICALLLTTPAFAGDEGSPAAEAGHAIKETGKAIGHGTRKVTTAIGHGFRDAAKAIGHGTRDTVHAVGGTVSKDTK